MATMATRSNATVMPRAAPVSTPMNGSTNGSSTYVNVQRTADTISATPTSRSPDRAAASASASDRGGGTARMRATNASAADQTGAAARVEAGVVVILPTD